ncbi:Uncharacterized protein FKW44_014443 [Caligus rogercresseyi]|uniref:Uncharacterized protein n=1 Tax=Caligus rogercresseyi TaxID=217165 RepID=A0A7T8GZM8_CALRO|nr:Uncharacterized protein FKW44_014443 [Caligus rogercresseyi]
MEEEKRHAMFASFRAGRSPKEVIEFFNYSKSTVYEQTDEFVAEVKRKVNEDGNKSYAKLAANTINKDLGYIEGDPGVAVGEPPYHWSPDLWPPSSPDCNPSTISSGACTLYSLRAAIVEEFANMKKDVVDKACGSFRHHLEMVVAADGGYIEK